MRATYITATLIAVVILAWLISGQIGSEGTASTKPKSRIAAPRVCAPG